MRNSKQKQALQDAAARLSKQHARIALMMANTGRAMTVAEIAYMIWPMMGARRNVQNVAAYVARRLCRLELAEQQWRTRRELQFRVTAAGAEAIKGCATVQPWLREARQRAASVASDGAGRAVKSHDPSACICGGARDRRPDR